MSRTLAPVRIERVLDRLPPGFDALCRQAEAEGYDYLSAFGARFAAGLERFDRDPTLYVALFVGDRLAAVGGVGLDPYVTEDGLGRVRHVYVAPGDRRSGRGARLVDHVVRHAHGRFARLRLWTDNPAAARLYERAGFFGVTETKATHALILPPPSIPTAATV